MNVWRNFSQILTLEKAFKKDGRHLIPKDLSILYNASIVFDSKEIHWVGADKDLPESYKSEKIIDFKGYILTPELVDCHTHLIFGGDRSKEYSMRLNGADYSEIAKSGGGILSTTKATNKLNSSQLYEISKKRIENINNYGIGTIEIKSGYGLNFDKEYELSKIILKLKKYFYPKVQIINTYMAAHAVPKEYESSKAYLAKVVIPLMKKLSAEKIIDAVDIFHEEGYFSYEDTQLIFSEAKSLSIPFKSHADEFQDNKGALLASSMNALSTDHLLCTSDDGIKSLAKSKTVATLLPGTGFFLGKNQANARNFLDQGCKVAIASDYNPGSCHYDNLLQIAAFSAPTLKLNQAELWSAITLNSSHALGLNNQGMITKFANPRFSIFKAESIDQITYNWGKNFSVNISDYLPNS